jgi:hypothetical protein
LDGALRRACGEHEAVVAVDEAGALEAGERVGDGQLIADVAGDLVVGPGVAVLVMEQ